MQHTNPYLVNCPRCNALNDTDAKFCKNCSQPFVQYQSTASAVPARNNDLNLMLIILGLFCFESLFYKFLEYVIDPIVTDGRGYGEGMSTIYTICSWGFNLVTLALAIIFIAKAKNKLVKIVLIIYGAIFLFNFFQYNIAPLFREENPFIYYQF
jgi:hypothetical protein